MPPSRCRPPPAGRRRAAGDAGLGAATFIDDRYEADDLIAILCRQLAGAGHAVVVVSSDKDLAKLVGEHVTFYDFGKGLRYGPADVRTAFGVRPDQPARGPAHPQQT